MARKEDFKIGEKVIVASFHHDIRMVDYKIGTITEHSKSSLFYVLMMNDGFSRTVLKFQLYRLSPVTELLYNIEE